MHPYHHKMTKTNMTNNRHAYKRDVLQSYWTSYGLYLVTCGMLHWSSHLTNIWGQTFSIIFLLQYKKKKIIRLFMISTSVVRT